MTGLIRHPKVESEIEAVVRHDGHGIESLSTKDVPPHLRSAVWEARNRSHLIGLRVGTPVPSGLEGTMRSIALNGLSIADITGNAHTVERTPELARTQRLESVMFTFVLAGESFHYTGSSTVLVKAGEVAVYDSDVPFLLGFSEGMHAVVASLPRYHLADIGMEDSFRSLTVLRHTGRGVESEATRHVLEVLVGAFDALRDGDPHDVGERVVEDILGAVRQLSGQPQRGTADYFTEACSHVERHLSDPDLSVATIARALSLSPRHLSRVFAASDTTVAQVIQQRRLARARELLTSTESAHLTAAEVGERSGFASASHFSRVFKNHFGMSPSEARRAGGTATRP